MLSRHSLSRPLSFSLCNWIISSQVLLDCIFHINRIFTFDLEWTIIGLYLSHQVSFYFSSSPFQIIIFGVLLNYIFHIKCSYIHVIFTPSLRTNNKTKLNDKKIIEDEWQNKIEWLRKHYLGRIMKQKWIINQNSSRTSHFLFTTDTFLSQLSESETSSY